MAMQSCLKQGSETNSHRLLVWNVNDTRSSIACPTAVSSRSRPLGTFRCETLSLLRRGPKRNNINSNSSSTRKSPFPVVMHVPFRVFTKNHQFQPIHGDICPSWTLARESLFCFTFSEEILQRRQGEKRASHAFSHACGHLSISRVSLDWLRKKADCS